MSAHPDDVMQLGREDGEYLISVYLQLIDHKPGPPDLVRSHFEAWASAEISACEHRLASVGCSGKQIKAWRRGCNQALRRGEKELQNADA